MGSQKHNLLQRRYRNYSKELNNIPLHTIKNCIKKNHIFRNYIRRFYNRTFNFKQFFIVSHLIYGQEFLVVFDIHCEKIIS